MQQAFLSRRTTIITIGLSAFLVGLGLARTNYLLPDSWVALTVLLAVIGLLKKSYFSLIGILLFGLALGWWRGETYLQKLRPYQQLTGQKVVLQVTAESDGVYENSQLSFDAGNIEIIKPFAQTVPGRIGVKGFGEAAVYRGDMVEVEGKLFMARGSRQARTNFADLKVIGRSGSSLETVRLKFLAGVQNALPEPLASFGLGLLIGQKTTLPEEVSRDLAIVGLTHIIAVSGYNLTIIIRAVQKFSGKRSKYQTLILSVLVIGVFLLVTGFSASIVRAAIVSMLSLLAWYYGRTFRPFLLLTLTAAITAGWYPLYLWSDIGWYLSFLAFYGVLILAPVLTKRICKDRQPNTLTLVITESLCAQAMTAPLILFIFNQVSSIGLLSNLLIVPLVPLGMLLALYAGLGGMLWPILAGWIAWPARLLLTYMLDLVHIMAGWPHVLMERSLSLVSMLILYACLLVITLVLWRKTLKTVKVTEIEIEE